MPDPPLRPLAIVTGASSGIGLELSKHFADATFGLVMAAEDDELSEAARMVEGMGASVGGAGRPRHR